MKMSAILFVLLLLSATSAGAQIRVLFGFDAAGHTVHKVVRDVESKPSLSAPGVSDGNLVLLTWYDSSGLEISRTYSPDPRIMRSPAHIDGEEDSTVIQDSGAWLVSGPDEAMSVAILLPRFDSLGLGPEHWHVLLEPID